MCEEGLSTEKVRTPVSPQARSSVNQGKSTRKAIIDAAVELFGRYGYRGCSLEQIATQAGIGRSGVLHHFGTKEQLLLETLEEHFPVSSDRPDVRTIASGEKSFLDLLEDAALRNRADQRLVRFFSVMAGESLIEDHPAHRFFIDRYNTIRRMFTEAINEAQIARGQVPDQQTEDLVALALAAMDGLQAQWLRNPTEVDLVEGMRMISELIGSRLSATS